MKHILIISDAGNAHTSGLVGGYIYKDLFEKNGYIIDFRSRNLPSTVKIVRRNPLLSDLFMHSKIRPFLYFVKNIISSILEYRIIQRANKYDLIYLVKVDNLKFIQKLKKRTNLKIVLYCGDAMWFYNEQFSDVLTLVNGIITDNEYTAAYLKNNNNKCYIVPDSPQIELFDKSRNTIKKNDTNNIILGWIGSQSTVYNLYVIWEALEKIFSRHSNLHLRLVGTGNDIRLFPSFEKVNYSTLPIYSQEEMVEEVFKMDIGLFPLQDIEASRVRGILKSCVYMSGETAVIASAVGQVTDLIEDGENGLLVYDNADWETKIEMLINDEVLRKKIAKNGLETVRREYSLEQNFKKLLYSFEQINL